MEKAKVKILYFSNVNCSACAALKPKVKVLIDREFTDFRFVDINITEKPMEAAKYMVFSVPAIIVSIDDKEHDRFFGSFSLEQVKIRLERIKSLMQY